MEDRRWKVVLRKEARSKCVTSEEGAADWTGIFRFGRDSDYDAIVPERDLSEEDQAGLPTGRNVIPNEVMFAERIPEDVGVDDADGNSSVEQGE